MERYVLHQQNLPYLLAGRYPLCPGSPLRSLLCMLCPLQLSLVEARQEIMSRSKVEVDFFDGGRFDTTALGRWYHDFWFL